MHKLILDIGNTRTKAAVFDGDQLVDHVTVTGNGADRLEALARIHGPFQSTMIASVAGTEPELDGLLFGKLIRVRSGLKLPLKISYKTPETLGADRLANAVGAVHINPGRNCLVIDAGTCIKYDLITADGTYPGGMISPGIAMRFKALHKFTGKLPALKNDGNIPALIGQSTDGSMRSGVINGAFLEAEGVIGKLESEYGQLDVILTGGDAGLFEGTLKNTIFAAPHLTLTGLKVILDHND